MIALNVKFIEWMFSVWDQKYIKIRNKIWLKGNKCFFLNEINIDLENDWVF
jgi:hypothetical protein